MKIGESLRDYTNRFFENRNKLAGVKDDDVISYYKKGVTNLKLFEKIHEAGATTIADLMVYVNKLCDTQDVIFHDFKGDKTDGALAPQTFDRSRKRSTEAFMTIAAGTSTFDVADFDAVFDDIY